MKCQIFQNSVLEIDVEDIFVILFSLLLYDGKNNIGGKLLKQFHIIVEVEFITQMLWDSYTGGLLLRGVFV